MSSPSNQFQWKPEHDALLRKIASDDDIEGSDWTDLKDALKYKLDQNVTLFLTTTKPQPPPPFNPEPSTHKGLKLPPFPPKRLHQLYLFDPPASHLTADQAQETKQAIYDQLDGFEDKPPFTIQRLCELLLEPKKHYKTIGKYLRAVEKSILVTSSHDAFPVPPEEANSTSSFSTTNGSGVPTPYPKTGPGVAIPPPSPLAFATRRSSTPSTPLFSPIPFLHADARSRSKSRSPPPPTPPMTPLNLADDPDAPVVPEDDHAIGLVDELDDPSPGHMSDKPTPLTMAGGGKPFMKTLETRFVKGETTKGDDGKEGGVTVKEEEGESGPSQKKPRLETEAGSEASGSGVEAQEPKEEQDSGGMQMDVDKKEEKDS